MLVKVNCASYKMCFKIGTVKFSLSFGCVFNFLRIGTAWEVEKNLIYI